VGSTVILHLEGRLTVEEDTHPLHELLGSITGVDPWTVVLDLANVPQLDCSGIGQLVQLNHQVGRSGGVLLLVNVDRRQKRLLELLGLLEVFRVCGSWPEGLMGRRTAGAPASLPSVRLEVSVDAARHSVDRVYAL